MSKVMKVIGHNYIAVDILNYYYYSIKIRNSKYSKCKRQINICEANSGPYSFFTFNRQKVLKPSVSTACDL